MSVAVEKIICPDCKSHSLQVFYNKDEALGLEYYTSYCFAACEESKGDPYADSTVERVAPVEKTEAEKKEDIRIITTCKIFEPKHKHFRGIQRRMFKSWKLRVILSEYDGKTPYAIAFPITRDKKLAGFKVRPFKKKSFFSFGDLKDVDMFGLERARRLKGDVLWVTEGEFDAIALEECLREAGEDKPYPVASLTHGGQSIIANFTRAKEKLLKRYKHIVLVLDDDTVGKNAEREAKKLWPDIITLCKKPKGCKDANDAIKNGYSLEMGKLALKALRRNK